MSILHVAIFALCAWRVRQINEPLALAPLAAAVLWGGIQAVSGKAQYRYDTYGAILHWLALLALLATALDMFQRGRARLRFLIAFAAFASGVALLSLLQQFTSGGRILWLFPTGYPDVFGPYVYRNNFAAFVELAIPVTVWAAFNVAHRTFLYGSMTAILFASVIAAASRAGVILVSTEIILATLLCARKNAGPEGRRVLLKLLLFAVVGVAVGGWETVRTRFLESDPFHGRREILLATLDMISERPWFGSGLGTYQTAYPALAVWDNGTIVNHAHNDWAEWAAEGGLPFAILLASAAAALVPLCFRSIWGLGIPAVFAHGLIDYPMQRMGVAVWLIGIIAAVISANSGSKIKLQSKLEDGACSCRGDPPEVIRGTEVGGGISEVPPIGSARN